MPVISYLEDLGNSIGCATFWKRQRISWGLSPKVKDGVRFTLFPLMSGSRPKVKQKVGVSNEAAGDSKWCASLFLLQKNEIMGID